jgi:hypothetical protein
MVLFIQLRVSLVATRNQRYDAELSMIQTTVADSITVRPRNVRIHGSSSVLHLMST